ncbi:hypothetical protein PHLCEN_2v5818 [Hermanssonia centrifuga]|uniref:Bicarbonate transporter-like transmembrane domain-containing protein n=1 Tax=Hermanssonia centrifuga TaxID=98765 RepID=A0A2R6P1A1_9APHY|nr:hypothetical protein PHLCEN_2v5818 [Hermanssonia centrifuga]
MAAFVFSVFGAQPLCILGVTGPITILNTTIFNIIERQPNPPNYLEFIGWVYLWGAILHWITAALNWCNFLRYVTLFFCDTFGFFTSWVYLQYGVQVITTQFRTASDTEAFVGIILALIMLVTCYLFRIASHSTLFHRHVRRFLADYGIPICLVACSAVAYWGRFNAANPATLPIAKAFEPAGGREWLVKFWRLEAKWVGIAFPFGIALWVLFFFDHNVSSLMAQGSQFPLRKPPGFHHDFFLLGITTLIAGLLGIPAPNGLLPQAPIHTYSLLVMGAPQKKDIESSIEGRPSKESEGEKKTPLAPVRSRLSGVHMPQFQHEPEPDPHFAQDTEGLTVAHEVPVAVVEQRVSNLAQGALCLVLLTGPFLHILNLIPRGVLAGLL